jgi:hypothetical protein
VLSRILQTRAIVASGVTDAVDANWHEYVLFEIAPHPDLSESQKKVIAPDYGTRGGKAKIKVRRALLYHALKRLGLDTDPSSRKPHEKKTVLTNRDIVLGKLYAGQALQEFS